MIRLSQTSALVALLGFVVPAAAQEPAPPPPAVPVPAVEAQPETPSEAAAEAPAASAAPQPVQPEPGAEAEATDAALVEGTTAEEDTGFVSLDAAGSDFQAEDEGPKLDIYGFADFSYAQLINPEKNGWGAVYQKYGSFSVGHLNLYLSAQIAEQWRSLVEVRFSYLPNGVEHAEADGSVVRTSTAVSDYAEFEKTNRWGGIIIERAWLEYAPLDFLTIRAGQWLTPYGFWNEDHGSPVIIAVHRPYAISDALFPERQTGLEVYGKLPIGESAIGYHLTVSNGRGPVDTYRDLDGNKAIGGRLFVETHPLGDLNVGVAAYRGSYTDSYRTYTADFTGSTPTFHAEVIKTRAYDEQSLSGEVRWWLGEFLLQSEVIMNEAAFEEGARPVLPTLDGGHYELGDYRRWGMYALAGYRTPWLGLMPFVMYEHHSFGNDDTLEPANATTIGVNIRPTANVALKAEYLRVDFDGRGSLGLGEKPLETFNTQAAWAF